MSEEIQEDRNVERGASAGETCCQSKTETNITANVIFSESYDTIPHA